MKYMTLMSLADLDRLSYFPQSVRNADRFHTTVIGAANLVEISNLRLPRTRGRAKPSQKHPFRRVWSESIKNTCSAGGSQLGRSPFGELWFAVSPFHRVSLIVVMPYGERPTTTTSGGCGISMRPLCIVLTKAEKHQKRHLKYLQISFSWQMCR